MRLNCQRLLAGLLATLLLTSVASAQVLSGEYTFAVEIHGVICGYADVRLTPAKGDDGPYTLFEQKTFVMKSALGSEFNTSVDLTFHIDPATGDFSYMLTDVLQAELAFQFEIRIDDGTAYCSSTLLDKKTRVALPEGVIIANPFYSLHLLRDFAGGELKEKTCDTFDTMEFEIQRTTFTWGGGETLELAGKSYDTFFIDILNHSSGVKTRIWLDVTNGMTVKVSDPRGQMVYLADPSIKKRIELVNMDENILAKTNVSIADVYGISSMKVRAVLEPTGQWFTPEDLNVPGQRFTGTVTDNLIEGVFEIEHPRYDGAGAPPYPAVALSDESLREDVEPGEFYESGDPVLIAKARELTEGSADSWEAACRLTQWVADNISYEIPGGGTARRTYDMRAGECGSHSILLATFCRAIGIPSRVVWGCMYSPTRGGAFGQHGWTEIHMGEAGWIPVDSTAHEVGFVDSGHIRLGILQSHSAALNAKSMEILDYRVASAGDQVSAQTDEGAYAAYVGEYGPPGGSVAFKVQVVRGTLAIDIRDEQVLMFKDADEQGRWFCTLTNNLYCTFDRDDAGSVVALRFHELVRMRRVGEPRAIDVETPPDQREFLGDYRFPGRPEPFVVSFDDDRLTVWYESRQALVHMDSTHEPGRWIDEFGANTLTFDRGDEGQIRALILEVVNTFSRR